METQAHTAAAAEQHPAARGTVARHSTAMERLAEGQVIPAMPLALDATRKFDERRQRALIRYYLASGAGGLAAGVHTTQFAIREPSIGLFKPVLHVVSEEIDAFEARTGAVIVKIAGVCGLAPQAAAEAALAARLGYDAVLLSPGGLAGLTEAAMLDRAREVAAILPVIGFYLQTSVGGCRLSFDFWRQLCEIDNIVAIKIAPFNRYQTLAAIRAATLSPRSDKIALYTGNDDNIAIDLLSTYRFIDENGDRREKTFAGGLLGHWAVWTNAAVQIFDALIRARARGFIPCELLILAHQITDANGAFFDASNNFAGCIAGIHEVLRRQGLFEGIWCLDENETLSPGQKDEIDRVCAMYPHLNDDKFVAAHLAEWLG